MAYFRSNTRSHHSARRTRRRGGRRGPATRGLLMGVTSAVALAAAAGLILSLSDDVIAAGDPVQSAAFDCRTAPADVLFIGSLSTAVPEQAAVINTWLARDIGETSDGTVRQVAYRTAAGRLEVSDRICFDEFSENTVFGSTPARQDHLRSADRDAVAEAATAAEAAVSRDPDDAEPLLAQLSKLLLALQAEGNNPKTLTVVTAASSGLGKIGPYYAEPDLPLRLLVVEPRPGDWRQSDVEAMKAWAARKHEEIELLPAPNPLDFEDCEERAVEKWIVLVDTTDELPQSAVASAIDELKNVFRRVPIHQVRVEVRTIGSVGESSPVYSACRGENKSADELAGTAWAALENFEAHSESPWDSKSSSITTTVIEALREDPVGISVISDFLLNEPPVVSLRENSDLDARSYAKTYGQHNAGPLPTDGILTSIRGRCTYLSSKYSAFQTARHRQAISEIFGCAIPRN